MKKISVLFYVLVPFLFIQFAFKLIVSEPYPCIIYPAFPGLSTVQDSVYSEKYSLEVRLPNDSVIKLSPSFLGKEIPRTKHQFVLKSIFAIQKNTLNTQKSLPQNKFVQELYRIRQKFSIQNYVQEPSELTKEWLLNKVKKHIKRDDVQELVFVEEKIVFIISTQKQEIISKKPVKSIKYVIHS